MKRLLSFLIASLLLFSCTYTLNVPEEKVNETVREHFPMKREVYFSQVELENPELHLLGNNRGEIKLDLKLKPPIGKEIKGKVDAIGEFQYDPKTATVYLTDLEPKEVKLNGKNLLSEGLRKAVRLIFRSTLKKVPVYRIEGKKAKLVKEITIEKGKMAIKLGV